MNGNAYQDWGASVPHGVGAHYYQDCGSTNIVAAEYARTKCASPIWIVAGSQSGGKGRKGRKWLSKEGNLYASLMFRPSIQPKDLAALPFIVALAVRDSLVKLGLPDADVQCKWPNDILIKGQKVCGILIESSARSAVALDYVIIGIGINLLDSPDDAVFPATSVRETLGQIISPRSALEALSSSIKRRLDGWSISDFEPTRQEWTKHAWGLGEVRRINTATEAFNAALIRLDEQGGLVARLENDEQRVIVAADIFPVTAQNNEET